MNKIILQRQPAVTAETGKSRSGLYFDIKQGLFPRQVSLGPRAVGWPAHEVTAINAARIAGKSAEEIRALVTKLHAERLHLCKATKASSHSDQEEVA